MFVNTLNQPKPVSTYVPISMVSFDYVQLIKFTRAITGLGLKESKDLVDANFDKNCTNNDLNMEQFIIGLHTINALKKEQS